MNEEQRKFPCKFCFHDEKEHFEYDQIYGQWEYLEDVGHEVWREEHNRRPMCKLCNSDCIFDSMGNLEYLEWLYDIHNPSSQR